MADIVHDTLTLPDGTVAVPYEAALAFHGNASAISGSSVTSGSLPPGLALDTALPFTRIIGTPTQDGIFAFQVTLTDAAGSVASGTLTIQVDTFGIDQGFDYHAKAIIKQEWPQA